MPGSDVTEYKRRDDPEAECRRRTGERPASFRRSAVLHSPVQLWILVALTIMVAGVMCTLSRGGVAALCWAFSALRRCA